MQTNRRMRKGWTLGVALLLVLGACGQNGDTNKDRGADQASPPKQEQNQPGGGAGEKPGNLIIATGGTGGTYYPLGGGMVKIITDKAKINANALVTNASVENMRLIKNKEVDLAFSQSDIADYASKGTEMYANDGPVQNLMALGALYNETIQIVVSAKSDIRSVADLKGKRVSVGAPGSGTEVNARQILEIYGMKFDDLKTERLSFADSAKKIQDGDLDVAFITAGAPTAAVTELGATVGVRVLSLEADKISALTSKYPFYTKQTIPANTYSGQTAEIDTVAVKAILTVRGELDQDLVYNITKALYENVKDLEAVNKKAAEMKTETALEGISIALHPGAKKYFDEKGVVKKS